MIILRNYKLFLLCIVSIHLTAQTDTISSLSRAFGILAGGSILGYSTYRATKNHPSHVETTLTTPRHSHERWLGAGTLIGMLLGSMCQTPSTVLGMSAGGSLFGYALYRGLKDEYFDRNIVSRYSKDKHNSAGFKLMGGTLAGMLLGGLLCSA